MKKKNLSQKYRMPYMIQKSHGKGYMVVNTETGKVHAEHATKENAIAQMRLLYGIESGSIKKVKRKY